MRKQGLRLPGCTMTGMQVDDIKNALQAQAIAESAHPEISVENNDQQVNLARQDAAYYDQFDWRWKQSASNDFTESTYTTCQKTRTLPHQSKSDPGLAKYNINKVEAQQETVYHESDSESTESNVSEQGRLARQHFRSIGFGRHLGEDDLPTNLKNHRAGMNNSQGDEHLQIFSQNSNHLHRSLSLGSGASSYLKVEANDLSSFMLHPSAPDSNSNSTSCDSTMMSFQRHFLDHKRLQLLLRPDSITTINSNGSFQALVADCNEIASRNGSTEIRTGPSAQDFQSYSHSCSSDFEPEIKTQLETSLRCHTLICPSWPCFEMKKDVKNLQTENFPIIINSKEEKILMAMYSHCCKCYQMRCPFYWCGNIKNLSSKEEILFLMKTRMEHFALDPFLGDAKLVKFIKLHKDVQQFPKEGFDWTCLTLFKNSRRAAFVLPTVQRSSENYNYWVIKKRISADKESLENLYQQLGKIQNTDIVRHLWAASFINPQIFVVCTFYQGVSLHEVLEGSLTLINSTLIIARLMLQLIQSTRYLHNSGILFLNWSSTNIVIDETKTKVKLADFTASSLKNMIEEDIGDIQAYLPVHLHPPELFQKRKELDEKSDVWGLGCLVHEMITGKPVWYQITHVTQEQLAKEITDNITQYKKHPEIPACASEKMVLVLKTCWKIEKSHRYELNGLELLMKQLNIFQ